jgi:integrase
LIIKELSLLIKSPLVHLIPCFDTGAVKARQYQKRGDTEGDQRWQKTQYRGIAHYIPSGTYFARIKVRGKLIRRSLKTDAITVAKMRLADLEKEERALAEENVRTTRGKMTFRDAASVLRIRIQASAKLKPRTKAYYSERIDALFRSWPTLPSREMRSITQNEVTGWAARFARDASPTAFNHTVGIMRQVFDIGVEHGARYNNPARAVHRMLERPKELRLPTAEQFNALVDAIDRAGVPHCHESAELARLLAYTGLRKMEAANLHWADVNFERRELIVRGDPEPGTKNRAVRRVPLIPEAGALRQRMEDNRRGDDDEALVAKQAPQ